MARFFYKHDISLRVLWELEMHTKVHARVVIVILERRETLPHLNSRVIYDLIVARGVT